MILISSILYQLHIDITTRQRKNGEQQNYIHNATSEVLRTNNHIQTVIRRLPVAVENCDAPRLTSHQHWHCRNAKTTNQEMTGIMTERRDTQTPTYY